MVEDAHTHTHTQVVRDNGGELAERVGTRCEQLVVLPREQGEGVCPLEAGLGQVDSVVPREVEGVSAADGCTRSLGGMKLLANPNSSCRGERECCPQGECPGVCGGECEYPRVCGYECGPGVRGVAVRIHQCV